MKRLFLSILSVFPLFAWALDANPLDNKQVNGPVKEIITIRFDYSDPKMTNVEKRVAELIKQKTYNLDLFDSKGHLIESGKYKNKVAEILEVWSLSDLSEYVYHGVYLNNKRKQKDDYHELIGYNPDGTTQQAVFMRGATIMAQERNEYNEKAQIVAHYTTLRDNPEFLQEAYTYDEQGRLIEYRYYYQPDQLSSGYTLEYTDTVVLKQEFWSNPEGKGDPGFGIYYLDNQGRVTKSVHKYGKNDWRMTEYLQYDEYGNWTDAIATIFMGDSQLLQLGDIKIGSTRINDAVLRIPEDKKQVTRIIRRITYY